MTPQLPDGLRLRTAERADVDAIGALLTERGESADAVDHRLIVDDPDAGLDGCAVIVDGDRVVSTATLLDESLSLDGLPLPVGQIELVATDPEYEGRGLVRALMAWAHQRSAHRGHLAQFLIGIPYFYRQFGYEYAVPQPWTRAVHTVPSPPDGHTVRRAGTGDIPAMVRLQDETQRQYALRLPHSPACWRWLVARTGMPLLVEHDGAAVGTGRITPPEESDVVLGEVAADSPAAARALLAHAATLAGGAALKVNERPGCLAGDAIEAYLAPAPDRAARYLVRVPDAVAALRHLRPVLSARLAGSDHADESGEAVVSFFRSHVRLAYANGRVDGVRPGGRMQAPGAVGGAGVAPDLVASLLFGPYGIVGLAQHHPDVNPGRNESFMHTLFPPVRADLLTLYLP